jgi:nucleoside-diphosphate-sugar epimerase
LSSVWKFVNKEVNMARKKVLVTGLSGVIGAAIKPYLEKRYELSALNRRDVPGVPCHKADIADFEAIKPAFKGIDTVVHLSAAASVLRSFEGPNAEWNEILQSNLIGCYNVFEASRLTGVKRIIFASSSGVIRGYESQFPYKPLIEGKYDEVPSSWQMVTHESPMWPWRLYGCSKVWGEALGRYFSDTFGISVICLRIGLVCAEDRPRNPREFSIWCSHRDMAQMVERCIDAPDSLKYDIFFVISNNKWGYRDISHARKVLGYKPQDTAEAFR